MDRRSFLSYTSAAFAMKTFAAGKSPVQVIAHRGEHRNCPENSASGIQAAALMGVDFVEMDVRTTSDGKLVLMHDATVDRMTGAKGAIASMKFAEVRSLGLAKSGEKIPTFEEALEILRPATRKTGVYLDAKNVSAADIMKALRDQGMLERCVVYGGPKLLAELKGFGPIPRIMPEAMSVNGVRKWAAELKPEVLAFDRNDWKDDVIAAAKEAGVRDLFVDRLGADDTPEAWEDAIRKGATGIQTDRPEDLLLWRGRV
jgi:glycerophosphoryl diester phosphodiesterase